jgi:hypothetical protein
MRKEHTVILEHRLMKMQKPMFTCLFLCAVMVHGVSSSAHNSMVASTSTFTPTHCFYLYLSNSATHYEKKGPSLSLLCEAHPPRGKCYYEINGEGSLPDVFQSHYCHQETDLSFYATNEEIARVEALISPDTCRFSTLEGSSINRLQRHLIIGKTILQQTPLQAKAEQLLRCAKVAQSRNMLSLGNKAGYEFYLITSALCKSGAACPSDISVKLAAYRTAAQGKTITGDSPDGTLLSARYYNVSH